VQIDTRGIFINSFLEAGFLPKGTLTSGGGFHFQEYSESFALHGDAGFLISRRLAFLLLSDDFVREGRSFA
jgi:hypothetical protein